jgi:hypothetical protein
MGIEIALSSSWTQTPSSKAWWKICRQNATWIEKALMDEKC